MKFNRRQFLLKSGAIGALPFLANQIQQEGNRTPRSPVQSVKERIQPITSADFLQRQERARVLMQALGYDALFLSGSRNLTYFCGISWGASDRLFALLIPRTGQPSIVCPAFEMERAKERLRYVPETIRTWQENEDPFRLSAALLREWGYGTGTIGIDGHLPYWYYDALARVMPQATYRNADPVTLELRLIKEAKEIALTRLAVEVTQNAFQAAWPNIRKGQAAEDLENAIAQAMAQQGAEGGAGVSIGQSSSLPHGSQESYSFQPGSVILIDGGCDVDHYPADITRTIVFGKAGEQVKKIWDTVLQAQTAAIQAIRPGVSCQEIDRTARKVIDEAGFGPGYRYFSHRLGHGLGLDGHDGACHLVEGNTMPLRPGMLFTVEPGIYIPGEFGVRLEDDIVVTEAGCEVLGNRRAADIDHPFAR